MRKGLSSSLKIIALAATLSLPGTKDIKQTLKPSPLEDEVERFEPTPLTEEQKRMLAKEMEEVERAVKQVYSMMTIGARAQVLTTLAVKDMDGPTIFSLAEQMPEEMQSHLIDIAERISRSDEATKQALTTLRECTNALERFSINMYVSDENDPENLVKCKKAAEAYLKKRNSVRDNVNFVLTGNVCEQPKRNIPNVPDTTDEDVQAARLHRKRIYP